MSEIAMREEHTALDTYQPTTPAPAERDLIEWVAQARAAHTLATTLCETAFVPAHFRKKPDDTAAAILTGHELGMSPLAAVRSIFIISGTPGMYAKAMVAVLQSKGHQIWVEEQSDERVVVCGRRLGTEHVARTVWDRARVVKAKLTTNAKYQESPQQMMVARGQAEICRQIAADALHGIPYAVEELQDMPPAVEPRARLTAADVIGAPAIEQGEPADAEVVDEPPVAMISDAQQRLMRVLLGKLGLGAKEHRDEVLEKVSNILDPTGLRVVTTSKNLTMDEARQVIDALQDEVDGEGRSSFDGHEDQDEAWPTTAEPAGGAE